MSVNLALFIAIHISLCDAVAVNDSFFLYLLLKRTFLKVALSSHSFQYKHKNERIKFKKLFT